MKIRIYYKIVDKAAIVGYARTTLKLASDWPLAENEIIEIETYLEKRLPAGQNVFIDYVLPLKD